MNKTLDVSKSQMSNENWLVESFYSNANDVDVLEVDEHREIWFKGEDNNCDCVDPWILNTYPTRPALTYSWQLEVIGINQRPVLVDYIESAEPFLGNYGMSYGFHEWIDEFKPKDWNDWLMIPRLYRLFIFDRVKLDWTTLSFTHDTWSDGQLKAARGVLLWIHQYIEMIAHVAKVSRPIAENLALGYCKKIDSDMDKLASIFYANGMTLLDLLKERDSGGRFDISINGPNYYVSSFLFDRWINGGNLIKGLCSHRN